VLAGEALCDSEKVESLAHSHLAAIEAIAAPQRQKLFCQEPRNFVAVQRALFQGDIEHYFRMKHDPGQNVPDVASVSDQPTYWRRDGGRSTERRP
jgi:hypothetical protein